MNKSDEQIKSFCRNIKYLRKKHGYSQSEMAKILGIGVNSLRELEREELPPSLSVDVVYAIAKNFGILPKDIFFDLKDD